MAGNRKRQQCVGTNELSTVKFRRSLLNPKTMVEGMFDLYGKKAFREERVLRQQIRQNFLECQQAWPKGSRPEFKTKNEGALTSYSLDYEDGTWVQLTYDASKALPKDSQNEEKS